MAKMRIAVPPSHKERKIMGDFMTSLILASKQRGAECQLMSPTCATIEGDEETLLEILDHIDNFSFSPAINNVAITMEFNEGKDKSLTRPEIEFMSSTMPKDAVSKRSRDREKTDKKLHDMVLKRLAKHIKG